MGCHQSKKECRGQKRTKPGRKNKLTFATDTRSEGDLSRSLKKLQIDDTLTDLNFEKKKTMPPPTQIHSVYPSNSCLPVDGKGKTRQPLYLIQDLYQPQKAQILQVPMIKIASKKHKQGASTARTGEGLEERNHSRTPQRAHATQNTGERSEYKQDKYYYV